MTISKHDITATVEGVEYETAPEYDIPEVIVYSQGFESISDGTFEPDDWNGGNGDSFPIASTTAASRSGSKSLDLSAGADVTVRAVRTFTGLTVSTSYTVSAWVRNGGGSFSSSVGVVGKSSTTASVGSTYAKITYVFEATATSHDVFLQVACTSMFGSTINWDDIWLGVPASTVPPTIATSYPLDIISADLTMDDSWSPYVQGDLTCWAPPEAALALIDPRDNLRVTITMTKVYGEEVTASYPAESVYSHGFEGDVRDSWTIGSAGSFIGNSTTARTGTAALATGGASTGAHADRDFTDLVIGAPYTFSAWVRKGNDTAASYSLGVAGIGSGAAVSANFSGGWKELTFTFTATATSHTLELIGPTTSGEHWDDITLTRNAYEVEGEYAGWNAIPHEDQVRTFDLLLREREVNSNDGTMTVKVESDEGLLQDFGLVSLSAERVTGLSVKAAVEYALAKVGATLEPGAADADIEPKTAQPNYTNLIANPSGETATTGWIADAARALTRVTHASAGGGIPDINNEGAYFLRYTFNGSLAASGPYYNGNFTAVAGQTYSYSVWVRSSKTQSVAPAIQWVGGAPNAIGSAVLLQPNVWTKLSLTATAPTGTTAGGPYFYNAAGTGFSNWTTGNTMDVDCLIVTQTPDDVDYFDGGTTDTVEFNYAWTGTANASTSTRTWIPNSDAMLWSPGELAWDWLEPLFQSVALRLYCNEDRQWILESAGTTREGQVNVAEGFNLTEGTDTISRYRDWFDSVVVKYTGNLDVNGQKYTTYDVAGAPGTKAFVVEYDRATPGPGAAQAILDKSLGKGRVLGLTGISDYTVTPGITVVATLPDAPVQTGLVSAVTWHFPDNTMTIESRGLTDTHPDAWILAPEGLAWEDIPAGTDWTEY